MPKETGRMSTLCVPRTISRFALEGEPRICGGTSETNFACQGSTTVSLRLNTWEYSHNNTPM